MVMESKSLCNGLVSAMVWLVIIVKLKTILLVPDGAPGVVATKFYGRNYDILSS